APSLSKLNFKWLAAGSCAQFSRHETFGVQHARGPAHAEFFYSGQHASRTTRIDQHVSTRKRQGSVQVQAIAFIIGIEKNLFWTVLGQQFIGKGHTGTGATTVVQD